MKYLPVPNNQSEIEAKLLITKIDDIDILAEIKKIQLPIEILIDHNLDEKDRKIILIFELFCRLGLLGRINVENGEIKAVPCFNQIPNFDITHVISQLLNLSRQTLSLRFNGMSVLGYLTKVLLGRVNGKFAKVIWQFSICKLSIKNRIICSSDYFELLQTAYNDKNKRIVRIAESVLDDIEQNYPSIKKTMPVISKQQSIAYLGKPKKVQVDAISKHRIIDVDSYVVSNKDIYSVKRESTKQYLEEIDWRSTSPQQKKIVITSILKYGLDLTKQDHEDIAYIMISTIENTTNSIRNYWAYTKTIIEHARNQTLVTPRHEQEQKDRLTKISREEELKKKNYKNEQEKVNKEIIDKKHEEQLLKQGSFKDENGVWHHKIGRFVPSHAVKDGNGYWHIPAKEIN